MLDADAVASKIVPFMCFSAFVLHLIGWLSFTSAGLLVLLVLVVTNEWWRR